MKVACFYNYEKSCVLVGQVENQSLIILNQEIFTRIPIQNFTKLIEGYESEIWVNRHSFLIGYQTVDLSLTEENNTFLQQLSDLFLSIKNDIKKECPCNFDEDYTQTALKILIYSFKNELIKLTQYVPNLNMVKSRITYRGGYRTITTSKNYNWWQNPDNWNRL